MSQKKKSSYTPKAIEDFDSSVLAEEIVEAVAVEELPVEMIEAAPVVSRSSEVHVVVKGDTLSSIAHMYCPADMDVDQFYRHLNLLNNRPAVAVGQVIKLFGGK
jgi:LysM repeat protein